MAVSLSTFEGWRAPRFGDANPTRMDNPLWASLIRDPINAYQVTKRYGHTRQLGDPPTWCFDRFGRTTTDLTDGRTVHIAGEHEDSYDPDFCIYNDVIIVGPGDAIAIYGYPREVFPPTDFHTATLDGDLIWLVGSLGYYGERPDGVTQVCRLDLATMSIARLATTGEGPGWIHRHTAELIDGAIVVRGGKVERGEVGLVENIDEWALDLVSLAWTRRTARDWQRWGMQRADRRRSLIWEVRQAVWAAENPEFPHSVDYRAKLVHETGREPELALLQDLYLINGARDLGQEEDAYNVWRIDVDGVVVRFTEEGWRIAAMVEGRLAVARLRALQEHVLARLGALENTAWELVEG